MPQDKIDKEGLTNVVHKRRKIKGKRPGLTCKAVSKGPVGRQKDECWLLPSRRPLCRQKRKITACLIKEVIKVVMRNHYYSYNNTTYRQTKGAGIGN